MANFEFTGEKIYFAVSPEGQGSVSLGYCDTAEELAAAISEVGAEIDLTDWTICD